MPNTERPQQNRRPQNHDQRPPRQQRPQRRPEPQQDVQGEPAPAPAPIRKKSSNAILVVVILVALIAVVALAFLFLPGACSRMQQNDGTGEISVINTEGSVLSTEELIDRAKERYAGTWVVSSVTWQGEEGDGSLIPQKVVINVDGSCVITQGEAEYKGQWEIDGESLYVNAQGDDGTTMTKVLSIDDTSLNISTNNGTGVYVRTEKPDLSKGSESAEE